MPSWEEQIHRSVFEWFDDWQELLGRLEQALKDLGNDGVLDGPRNGRDEE